jgi:hypothetical protein
MEQIVSKSATTTAPIWSSIGLCGQTLTGLFLPELTFRQATSILQNLGFGIPAGPFFAYLERR